MTIENAELPRKDYLGNGNQRVFPYTWKIFSPSDLEVWQGSALLELFVHYTVSGAGEPDGGNVELVAAVPDQTWLTVLNAMPAIQGTDFREGDGLSAEVVEAQHDRDVRISQQILEVLRRVPVLSRISRFVGITLPDPVLGKILGWKNDLSGLENQDKAPKGDQGIQGIPGPPGAGAAPSVSDGVTTIAVPTAIQFPQASGFSVDQPSAGVARVQQTPIVPIPVGGVIPFGAAAAPAGWLLCNGAAVSRTTFAALFAVIGVAFGVGDGATTFNVPDLRGRFPLGAGIGPGLTTRAVAATGGEEAHVLTAPEIPAHQHAVNSGTVAGAGSFVQGPGVSVTPSQATQSDLTGGGGAHNTMPPWTGLAFIIKA